MSENNIDELKERQVEIESTLNNLAELMDSRNNVLTCFEKNVLRKTINHLFSNLNTSSKGSMLSGMTLIKKSYELDIKLFRRGLFYLQKRKRGLEEELTQVKEDIEKLSA